MSQYPLPLEDLEGDLTVTVIETVGVDRELMKLSASIDFAETMYTSPSSLAGPIMRWNHDFTFPIAPADAYLHITLHEVEEPLCGGEPVSRAVAHAHVKLLSLLCEDDLARQGLMHLAVPLELVDKAPPIKRVAEPHGAKVADEFVIDMGSAADAGFATHIGQTPRQGPWQPFQTMMTPRRPAAPVTPATGMRSPARTPAAGHGNLFLAQRSGTRPQPQEDAFPRSQHPSTLFGYKSDAPGSRDQASDPARAQPSRTPMRRASALSLLTPADSARGLPKVEATPQLYMDLPELVRLRLAWKPRWAAALCRDMLHMVSSGTAWKQPDADAWLSACGLPSPGTYIWPRIVTAHCHYQYEQDRTDGGYTSAAEVVPVVAAPPAPAPTATAPVTARRMSLVRRSSTSLAKPDLFPDRGVAPARPDADETATPLRVISFMSTFALQELCRMHRCCAKRFGKNKVTPRVPLTESDLLKARLKMNGRAAPEPLASISKPFSPSRAMTPSTTPLKSNNTLRRFPAIAEYGSPMRGVIRK